MKSKVLTLILLIPLVLMVCVFSAANFTALQIPISVNSVAIYHENLEVINLAENNVFQINAQAMPINASNKGLIYSYESVNGKQLPNLEIDENGMVKASGVGSMMLEYLSNNDINIPNIKILGFNDEIIPHGKNEDILKHYQLDDESILEMVKKIYETR